MIEHDLRAVAFPTLDEGQLAALERCAGAALKRYVAGQTLFQAGDRDFKFFVVKSGEIEIRDESGETPKTLVVLRRGEFTGLASPTGAAHAQPRFGVHRTDCSISQTAQDQAPSADRTLRIRNLTSLSAMYRSFGGSFVQHGTFLDLVNDGRKTKRLRLPAKRPFTGLRRQRMLSSGGERGEFLVFGN
jgi:cyclic nucleotide-binding protein